MTEEAKRIVETLRYCEESGARCEACPSGKNREGIPNCHSQSRISDLIEQLSAELEQEQQASAGLEIMLTVAQSNAETWKRKFEAAQPKWTSVQERLPEQFVAVLVYMPDEHPFPTVHEGYLRPDGFWYSAHFTRHPSEVTHWANLPQPPEE